MECVHRQTEEMHAIARCACEVLGLADIGHQQKPLQNDRPWGKRCSEDLGRQSFAATVKRVS